MEENRCAATIQDQTQRMLWEVQNVLRCIPDDMWDRTYCDMPLWKHVYHMLHSLDKWFINPRDSFFMEPVFHRPGLDSLDTPPQGVVLSKKMLLDYYAAIQRRIRQYIATLRDEMLPQKPKGSDYDRITLVLAQYRHLHTHMGMLMGFIVAETGRWPMVLGLEGVYPPETQAPLFAE